MYTKTLFLLAICILVTQSKWQSLINEGTKTLETAFNNRNFDQIRKLFARKCSFTFTGTLMAMTDNNKDTANWFRNMSNRGMTKLTLEPEKSIINLGSKANERGTYYFKRKSGKVIYQGEYLTVWSYKNQKLEITMSLWTNF